MSGVQVEAGVRGRLLRAWLRYVARKQKAVGDARPFVSKITDRDGRQNTVVAGPVGVWAAPFTRGRHMRPTDIGLRFEDVYYNRFGIAVEIYEWVHDRSSSSGPKHDWLVVDATGHRTDIQNCFVEEPAGPHDHPYRGRRY